MFAVKAIFVIISFHLLLNIYITEASDPSEPDVCQEIKPTSEQEYLVNDTIVDLGRNISYAQWDDHPPGNVVLSPLSIGAILNLLMTGTKGPTSSQIKEALKYPHDLDECVVHQVYHNIFSFLQNQPKPDVEISVSTKLFVQEKFPILESFKDISRTYYFSEDENVDFKNSPKDATDRINEWASDRTEGKVEKLFLEPLDSDTKFVLANVVSFNATWENKFDRSKTVDGTFHAEMEKITIPMMREEIEVPYLTDSHEELELVSLPYVGNRFSLYILRPINDSDPDLLQKIENRTSPSELEHLINRMKPTLIDVTIPRMKLDFRRTLNEDLEDLGIKQIFNKGADFGRMTTESNLTVSVVVHKSILEVTEYGTDAASETAEETVEGVKSRPRRRSSPKFVLDKPSLLFIRDNKHGLIVFWSRVMKPEPYYY